ncbi:uncharacterized protein LOC144448589 isoform X2 [Glandiceps talaboti]
MEPSYMYDRDFVIKLIKHFVEVLTGEETLKWMDREIDPSKPEPELIMLRLKTKLKDIEKQVLRENGIGDDKHCDYFEGSVRKVYDGDEEVLSYLEFMGTPSSTEATTNVGDTAFDVKLVTMDTKETIPLSSFQRKNRPLLIAASSFS